jgi:hypothetical protein
MVCRHLQVWHAVLLRPFVYRALCEAALQTPGALLNHVPVVTDRTAVAARRSATRALHEQVFGEPEPALHSGLPVKVTLCCTCPHT